MVIRESQFDVLARDLDNPALQAQRKNLTQLQVTLNDLVSNESSVYVYMLNYFYIGNVLHRLQAEHKMQKQILKSLQQDHRNIQVNAKHNIGV